MLLWIIMCDDADEDESYPVAIVTDYTVAQRACHEFREASRKKRKRRFYRAKSMPLTTTGSPLAQH